MCKLADPTFVTDMSANNCHLTNVDMMSAVSCQVTDRPFVTHMSVDNFHLTKVGHVGSLPPRIFHIDEPASYSSSLTSKCLHHLTTTTFLGYNDLVVTWIDICFLNRKFVTDMATNNYHLANIDRMSADSYQVTGHPFVTHMSVTNCRLTNIGYVGCVHPSHPSRVNLHHIHPPQQANFCTI